MGPQHSANSDPGGVAVRDTRGGPTLDELIAAGQAQDFVLMTLQVRQNPELVIAVQKVFPIMLRGLEIRIREVSDQAKAQHEHIRELDEELAGLRRRCVALSRSLVRLGMARVPCCPPAASGGLGFLSGNALRWSPRKRPV